MSNERNNLYASRLSEMLQAETVSVDGQTDKTKFYRFHELLRKLFPNLFSACVFEEFDGSVMLRWTGSDKKKSPIMLMNHHDVVEATGEWKYPPFSGTVADGKIWGRGALDTKGGLFGMLMAADELIAEGFVPERDVYFVSTCTEETGGEGAKAIVKALKERGIRLAMTLDEGGMMVREPIGGAKGVFAMIGVGEKGCADLKFIARSNGGHASAPEKNTPMVRLGKFMAAAEEKKIFKAELSDTVAEMFRGISTGMKGALKIVLGHPRFFSPILTRAIPGISATAGAMLKTTVAFTMAGGSEGANVIPREAWVIGNMRYSHHQGKEASIKAITELAAKYGVDTVILDGGVPSGITDRKGAAFKLTAETVSEIFPDVKSVPYVMTGASDSRFFSEICDQCIRFTPFIIDNEQLESVHGANENVDTSALAPAVDFYKEIIRKAQNRI